MLKLVKAVVVSAPFLLSGCGKPKHQQTAQQSVQSMADLQEATAARALFQAQSSKEAVDAAHALGQLDHPHVVTDLSADARNRDQQHCTGNSDKGGPDAAFCFQSYNGKADGKVIKADIEGLTAYALRSDDAKVVGIVRGIIAPLSASSTKLVADAADTGFAKLQKRNLASTSPGR